MNALCPTRIRRYRLLHRAFWLAPFILGVAIFAISKLAPAFAADYSAALGIAALLVIVAPLAALNLLYFRVMRAVDPDPQLRRQVLKRAWLGPNPFGYIWAFHELLDEAARLYTQSRDTQSPAN